MREQVSLTKLNCDNASLSQDIRHSDKCVVLWISTNLKVVKYITNIIAASSIVHFCSSNKEALAWIHNNAKIVKSLVAAHRFKLISSTNRTIDGNEATATRVIQQFHNLSTTIKSNKVIPILFYPDKGEDIRPVKHFRSSSNKIFVEDEQQQLITYLCAKKL